MQQNKYLINALLEKIFPFLFKKVSGINKTIWLINTLEKINLFASASNKKEETQKIFSKMNNLSDANIPTSIIVNTELDKMLGKPLFNDFQKYIDELNTALDKFHHFITDNLTTNPDSNIIWYKLSELIFSIGQIILPLCNEEAKLRAEKNNIDKYEQISILILFVENLYRSLNSIKNEFERNLNFYKKTQTINN